MLFIGQSWAGNGQQVIRKWKLEEKWKKRENGVIKLEEIIKQFLVRSIRFENI